MSTFKRARVLNETTVVNVKKGHVLACDDTFWNCYIPECVREQFEFVREENITGTKYQETIVHHVALEDTTVMLFMGDNKWRIYKNPSRRNY